MMARMLLPKQRVATTRDSRGWLDGQVLYQIRLAEEYGDCI